MMGEAQRSVPAPILVQHAKEGSRSNLLISRDHHQAAAPVLSNFARSSSWWLRVTIFIIFVLCGQSVAILLGRLYFNKGGNSKWMATLVQTVGFPILIPFVCLYPTKHHMIPAAENRGHPEKKSSLSARLSLYVFLGIFMATNCMLYTIGLAYLPVSTYSLICSSLLAFNALFSYLLNGQKFTPFIVNSVVLLTISSTLLVFQNDKEGSSSKTSKGKYAIGFICTVGASAVYGFNLALTQLGFRKILKAQTFRVVLDVTIFQSLVATLLILIGFFASSEWKTMRGEMEGFELGRVSYVMILVWTAVSWQVLFIGMIGLIFEVSSLFANVISTLGMPMLPVFAVVFFHDKMNGVKVIALLLSLWGFTSYIYQHYLDELKSKAEAKKLANEVSITGIA